MKLATLPELNLLDFGNTIDLCGVVYGGNGHLYFIPLPGEPEQEPDTLLRLGLSEWEEVIRQTDLLNVEAGPKKIVLRKSQRQIDTAMSWRVFERDDFRCRYCGKRRPLTVDHIDLWEDGGLTIEANLVSACKDCNKTRGRRTYEQWMFSQDYQKRSIALNDAVRLANSGIILDLPELRAKRIPADKIRSR